MACLGALGRGGQRLYVVPTLNLVVAVIAGLYSANGGSPAPESLAVTRRLTHPYCEGVTRISDF